MTGSSLIALPLAAAREAVREHGGALPAVKQTRPPRGAPSGPLRVIRQRSVAGSLELVVAASVPLPETERPHD
ncbi:MAG: hypothetical protein ACE149_02925 [Armatimonadota bacterium]